MIATILKEKEPYKTTKGTFTKIKAEVNGKETLVYSKIEDDPALNLKIGDKIEVYKNEQGAYMLKEKSEKINLNEKPVDPQGVLDSVNEGNKSMMSKEETGTTDKEVHKDWAYYKKAEQSFNEWCIIESMVREPLTEKGYTLEDIRNIVAIIKIDLQRR